MEYNKNLMMGLLAVGLCLGLLWGVSPSMAASVSQTYQIKQVPKPRFKRQFFKKNDKYVAPKLYKSPNPGYTKNAPSVGGNISKFFNHTDAGKGPFNINIGKPYGTFNPTQQNITNAVDNPSIFHRDNAGKSIDIGKPFGTFNPNLLQNHSKAWQAMQAAKAKAQQDAWNKSGGYGGNGGNGVLPPGPARVPGSTPPPANSGPPLCIPDILSGGGVYGVRLIAYQCRGRKGNDQQNR